MDWDASGLLDGLEGRDREARLALLDELHSDGVPLEELRRAVAEERLVLLPLERALLGAPRYTAAEAAERAGIELDLFSALQRAVGLAREPDAAAFGDDDVEAARRFAAYAEAGLPAEDLVGVVRTLSAGLARSAEAVRGSFARAFLQPGDTEHDLGRRYRAMAEALMPALTQDVEYLLRLHLREFARHDAVPTDSRATGAMPDAFPVAVAFADLVGFTALGEERDDLGLEQVADRLTALAQDRVVPPARIVKTIGDAVMFVAPHPGDLIDALIDLLAAVEADPDLPPLRAGVAWGPARPRYGDWYGATVNLAARLAARARPRSILVTHALREELREDERYEFSRAGPKRLRGFSEPVRTWRVRSR